VVLHPLLLCARLATLHEPDTVLNLLRQWPVDPSNGLINTSDVLIDWPSGMRDNYVLTQHNSVANAFGVYGLDTLVEIAGYLGRTADVAKYKVRADDLRASINEHLWSAKGGAGWTSGGAYTDGLPCKNSSFSSSADEKGQPPCFPCSSHAAFHSSVCACDHLARYSSVSVLCCRQRGLASHLTYSDLVRLSADMLALGAVPQDKVSATHEYIQAKILPKSTRRTEQTESPVAWPPPPPAGEHDGMPCGVYVSQFTLQALYRKAGDHGQAALELLTSNAKNSWLNMIKQGATASMEAWTIDEKPNLTWRYAHNHLSCGPFEIH
jgi:hypothetical protein